MGGAYTALAEGIDGANVNAASPAVREPFSFDWFDYDIDLDASLPGAYGGTDFDNRGPNPEPKSRAIIDGFLYAHAGLQVQLGEVGTSASAEFFQYDVRPATGGQGLTLLYGRYHALVGYGAADNQIVLGAGVRVVTLQVKAEGSSIAAGQTLLTLDGVGPEVGAVYKPNGLPFRFGATLRSPVSASVANGFLGLGGGSSPTSGGVQREAGLVLPARATQPWELETGFVFQLGPRPLNPAWLDPHDMEGAVRRRIARQRLSRQKEYARELAAAPAGDVERLRHEQELREIPKRLIEEIELDSAAKHLRDVRAAREVNWPRERITILGSLLVTGASDNAVSLEGFETQTQVAVGRKISLTPRVGIESEPVPNWVHARVGSYLEPSRFDDGTARQHFTFGADVKLFHFSPWGIFGDEVWRINFSADLAPRYQNFGIGLGAWH
jgi:hypothetical protein